MDEIMETMVQTKIVMNCESLAFNALDLGIDSSRESP